MQESIQIWLGRICKIGIAVVIFSTLFLFTNLTTDFYDSPKFIVLLVVTSILLIVTALKFTLSSKVVLVRTSLDIPLLLLLAVGAISTFLSPSPYISLLGQGGLIHGSFVALATYILFYFVAVNNLRSVKDVRTVLFYLTLGGVILSVISLLAYAGLKLLPPPWSHGVNFTPSGNNFSTTALLVLLIPNVVIEILGNSKLAIKLINAAVLALFGTVIVLTGVPAIIIASLAGLFITLYLYRAQLTRIPSLTNPGPALLIAPIVIIALIAALSFIPPFGNSKNPFYTLSQNFPREIQLPLVSSWKISVSSFRDSPFWGTGPATYLFNFTSYKPVEFNNTKFWNSSFNTGFNEYFSVLATLGGVGFTALVFATAFFLSSAYRAIKSLRNQLLNLTPSAKLHLSLAISGIVFFVILALHGSTLTLMVVGILILAAFMSINQLAGQNLSLAWKKESGFKQVFMRVASSMNLTDTSSETLKVESLPTIMLTISIALAGFALFFCAKFALADYHHRQALNAISQNQGIIAYNELVAAEKLNPINDLYRTDLAQTNFALANAIAIAKGPTEASPAGSLTDTDKQNIQVLLSQAISEGRTATALNPRSALDWEILGSLYRQISGVAQNALLFSLDSYGRSIQNDPLNPLLRLSVGGVYYAIQNYDMAIRFFTDAVNLKPDYANGYYNLSVAYRDKGDLQSAITTAQQVVKLITDQNSQDYKAASDYLKDLQSKVPSATQSASLAAPTSQDSGALQQKELPKVVELPKPENIATPAAVKKANASPEPSFSPESNPSTNP